MKYALITLLLFIAATSSAHAYTYASGYGYGNNGYISRYNGGTSGGYSQTWRGSDSRYIRNFGRSGGSGSYFGVPRGSSVGGSSYISRKHRGQYRAQLRQARLEQERLNTLPVPCGNYGRAPVNCPVTRFNTQAPHLQQHSNAAFDSNLVRTHEKVMTPSYHQGVVEVFSAGRVE